MRLLSMLGRDLKCERIEQKVDEESLTKISRPTKTVVCWGLLRGPLMSLYELLLCIRVMIKDANHRY